MIIDSHAHTFPDQGTAPGFARPEEFFRLLQHALNRHGQPTRRARDNAVVDGPPIWNPADLSPAGFRDVDFRAGRFGRFVWTVDGVDYYKQLQPAWLDPLAASPELVTALMDNAGVDRCVLQNDPYYGKLNDFFGDCVRRYPERFLGTIHVDETHAHEDASLRELRRGATELGLRGLCWGAQLYWLEGYDPPLDDDRLRPFWTEVERLGLAVYWSLSAGPMRDEAGYLDQVGRVGRVLERHPTIPSVLVGGFPNRYFDDPRRPLPAALEALSAREDVLFELVFPISVGRTEDFPFPSALEAVHRLYDRFGPARLVWGSDAPNVERHCTYRQSLAYLADYCTFLSAADRELILGGNLAGLIRLDEGTRR
jgi:predicted TIM-barrel fold metal-dependent hydrolase